MRGEIISTGECLSTRKHTFHMVAMAPCGALRDAKTAFSGDSSHSAMMASSSCDVHLSLRGGAAGPIKASRSSS